MQAHPIRILVILAVLACTFAALRADPPSPPRRKPWTTSHVVGSPEPPPAYRTVNAFPNVRLNRPLLLVRAPGTDRLFAGEQDGRIYSIANRPDAKADLFLDLVKNYKTLKPHPGATRIEAIYGLV